MHLCLAIATGAWHLRAVDESDALDAPGSNHQQEDSTRGQWRVLSTHEGRMERAAYETTSTDPWVTPRQTVSRHFDLEHWDRYVSE